MFVRRKKLPGDRVKVQVVKSVRSGGKVRQRVLRHVGTATSAAQLEQLEGLARLVIEEMRDADGSRTALFSPKEFVDLLEQSRRAVRDPAPFGTDLADCREESRVVVGVREGLRRRLRPSRLGPPVRRAPGERQPHRQGAGAGADRPAAVQARHGSRTRRPWRAGAGPGLRLPQHGHARRRADQGDPPPVAGGREDPAAGASDGDLLRHDKPVFRERQGGRPAAQGLQQGRQAAPGAGRVRASGDGGGAAGRLRAVSGQHLRGPHPRDGARGAGARPCRGAVHGGGRRGDDQQGQRDGASGAGHALHSRRAPEVSPGGAEAPDPRSGRLRPVGAGTNARGRSAASSASRTASAGWSSPIRRSAPARTPANASAGSKSCAPGWRPATPRPP